MQSTGRASSVYTPPAEFVGCQPRPPAGLLAQANQRLPADSTEPPPQPRNGHDCRKPGPVKRVGGEGGGPACCRKQTADKTAQKTAPAELCPRPAFLLGVVKFYCYKIFAAVFPARSPASRHSSAKKRIHSYRHPDRRCTRIATGQTAG